MVAEDGRLIFFTRDEGEDYELATENERATSGRWTGPWRDGSPSHIRNPGSSRLRLTVSPDGRSLAFLSTPARGEQTDLLVAELGPDGNFRGEPRNLTSAWDLRPGAPHWTADGSFVLFSAGIEGDSHLFRAADGQPVEQVTRGERRLSSFSFSANGDVMAFTATDAVTPAELYLGSPDGSTEQKVTGFNDDWLSQVTLMPAEELVWSSNDGTEVQGWVVKPVGFTEGGSYPMILKIHGGPHSAYGNTFFPTFHVLSAAGFFVLYTNPRGSSGYGHDFQYATRGEWGIVDREDYLSGVDAALSAYPQIDSDRLGVSGGQLRRLHDQLADRHRARPLPCGGDLALDRQLGELVGDLGRAGTDRVRVLRDALGGARPLPPPLADFVCGERGRAHTHHSQRKRLPDADR